MKTEESSQEKEIKERGERLAKTMHYIFYRVPTGRNVEKRHKSSGKRTEESRVEQLLDDG